jgi:hypothetical protein
LVLLGRESLFGYSVNTSTFKYIVSAQPRYRELVEILSD